VSTAVAVSPTRSTVRRTRAAPIRHEPAGVHPDPALAELRTGVTPGKPPADPLARAFNGLDKALHRISIPDMSTISGAI
jgi:hypothetical protein